MKYSGGKVQITTVANVNRQVFFPVWNDYPHQGPMYQHPISVLPQHNYNSNHPAGPVPAWVPQNPAGTRRERVVFTPNQLERLQEVFGVDPYPSHERREQLAQTLNLQPKQVKSWFQNSRSKLRKQAQANRAVPAGYYERDVLPVVGREQGLGVPLISPRAVPTQSPGDAISSTVEASALLAPSNPQPYVPITEPISPVYDTAVEDGFGEGAGGEVPNDKNLEDMVNWLMSAEGHAEVLRLGAGTSHIS